MGSRRTFILLAAAAIALPSVAAAQETGTRIVVIGAMQETGTRIIVTGAMQETGTRIIVTGASRERAGTQGGEDPADRNIPALPVVYEDETPAPVQAQPAPAPARR